MKILKRITVCVAMALSMVQGYALTISKYFKFITEQQPESFNAYTDLSSGFVMLSCFGLDKTRSYGPFHYKHSEGDAGEKQITYSDASLTSMNNIGTDAMTKLCCQLFPSDNHFNAQGSGSLEETFSKENRNDLVRLIALGLEPACEAQKQLAGSQDETPILSKIEQNKDQKTLPTEISKYISGKAVQV